MKYIFIFIFIFLFFTSCSDLNTDIVLLSRPYVETNTISGEYIEIHSLQGLHSGANAISGDFSFGASGYLCENGIRIKPIKGITVAGNYHKMLLDIKAIGDMLHTNGDKSFFAPKIMFNKISIAGI